MGNKEEVVLRGGFDGTGIDSGAKKAFGSLDAQAKKAQAGLNRFGLDADGVLAKLARQLSLTDIAAGAVFATIAKSQQIMRDSLKAYEDYSRTISVAGDGVVTYSERLDELSRAIKDNDIEIGKALSGHSTFWKEVEKGASDAVAKVAEFIRLAKEAANLQTSNQIQRQFASKGLGFPSVTFADSTPTGMARYGPDLPQELARAIEDDKRSRDENTRAIERLFDNLVRGTRPGSPQAFGAAGGLSFGLGDIQGPFGMEPPRGVPGTPQWQGPVMNDEMVKAYEEAQEASRQFREQFAANIGNALSSVILDSKDFAGSIKEIFSNVFRQLLSDAASSGVSALLGGGTVGMFANLSGGRTAPGVTPSTQSMARTLAPALRREASVGRG